MILKGLESGTYTLKVVETEAHLVSEKTITITKTATEPPKDREEPSSTNSMLIILVVVALIALIAYAAKTK